MFQIILVLLFLIKVGLAIAMLKSFDNSLI